MIPRNVAVLARTACRLDPIPTALAEPLHVAQAHAHRGVVRALGARLQATEPLAILDAQRSPYAGSGRMSWEGRGDMR